MNNFVVSLFELN